MASKKQNDIENSANNIMNKFFSAADQYPQEAPEQAKPEKPGESTTSRQKATTTADKAKKKVFSFWADKSKQDAWRTYAKVKNITVSELGVKAIDEYIKRHKLTEKEQQIFDLYMDS